ncbi:MAG: short-chain dehydrogenase [Pseudonocardiales bacterium]|nr:MAG: short-chain dehydrogenase [Pseudonocardiales bacterium]
MTERLARGPGRVALVTGAQQGIGRTIAHRLHRDGARLVVNDILRTDALLNVAAEVDGLAVHADVSDARAVRAMVADVEATLGSVEILVCNAAVETLGELTEQDPAEWWHHLDVNLTGTIELIQAVLPAMRGRRAGHIVVLASIWGYTGWPRASAYAASKTGLVGLTQALGPELRRDGVTITAVAPGIIDAPQIQVDADDAGISLDDMRTRYSHDIPLGRLGTTPEVAAAVSFLTGPAAKHYTGQTVHANGGGYRGPS